MDNPYCSCTLTLRPGEQRNVLAGSYAAKQGFLEVRVSLAVPPVPAALLSPPPFPLLYRPCPRHSFQRLSLRYCPCLKYSFRRLSLRYRHPSVAAPPVPAALLSPPPFIAIPPPGAAVGPPRGAAGPAAGRTLFLPTLSPHFADVLSPSPLQRLLKGEGGAAECQNSR